MVCFHRNGKRIWQTFVLPLTVVQKHFYQKTNKNRLNITITLHLEIIIKKTHNWKMLWPKYWVPWFCHCLDMVAVSFYMSYIRDSHLCLKPLQYRWNVFPNLQFLSHLYCLLLLRFLFLKVNYVTTFCRFGWLNLW